MRIVLSLGGSILVPALAPEQFREYAAVITTLAEEHDVSVVTGSGSLAREFIDVGRASGANEVELDQIGIGVARLNARLLILIYATNVPGIFSVDPYTHPDAEPFDELSASQLITLILNIGSTPGSSVPIDLLAAKMIQRANCETVVIDGTDPERILTAVRTGELEGTRIISDGEEDTSPAET
ncbi:amino acid kinase family protein [Halegenticoccus tardaugens]|uniref:amino acid kinase family protein n=1 Tax=Halegenticoccus tardaugens TaxID=2071624 RepID=UPI00100B05C6|nr:hypothetical protein [Halegenticoccus tardaugens]